MLKMKELRKRILSLMLVTSCILSGNPAKAMIPLGGEATKPTNQSETSGSNPKNSRENPLVQGSTDNNVAPPAQDTNSTTSRSGIGSPSQNTINVSPSAGTPLETELNNLYDKYSDTDDTIFQSIGGNINFNVKSKTLHHILHGNEIDDNQPLIGGHTFTAIENNTFYEKTPRTIENSGVREYRVKEGYSLKSIFPDTWKLKDLINAIRLTTIENQKEIPKTTPIDKGYIEIVGYYKGVFIQVVYNQIGNTNEYDIITAYPILSDKLRDNSIYAKKAILDLIKPEEGNELDFQI